MRGLVTLLEANRPTVTADDGASYLCYLKGRIKRDVGRILVGDRVEIEATDPGEARITSVESRTNTLLRPPVANVGGLFVVFTIVQPQGSFELLDKRLVAAHLAGMRAEIILSKSDVADPHALYRAQRAYELAGYRVWRTAALDGLGVDHLMAQDRQGIWVLTGESGAGKSTLLNAMLPLEELETQELSRIGRGQQTTRWVRLYSLVGGRGERYWLADSPGYTALEAQTSDGRAIVEAFEEFTQYRCRFADCLHGSEPGCAVTQAVEQGTIADWRYHHYRKLLAEWVKTYGR